MNQTGSRESVVFTSAGGVGATSPSSSSFSSPSSSKTIGLIITEGARTLEAVLDIVEGTCVLVDTIVDPLVDKVESTLVATLACTLADTVGVERLVAKVEDVAVIVTGAAVIDEVA